MDKLLWITNGQVIDPANKKNKKGDVFAKNGKIVSSLTKAEKEKANKIDAKGLVVCPGFVDIHVHMRFPGQTHKETIKSCTEAAAAGGVTTIVCMPNTSPCSDNAGTIQQIKDAVERDSLINIYTTGAITVGRKGEQLAPLGSLKDAGVVALTDDGNCIQNNEVMRRACEYAHMFNLPILDHCQDAALTQHAVMNEGEISTQLGLQGWPNAAEDIIVARNIILSQYTGAHIHMQHLSSGYSVELLRQAKKQGIKVTSEVTPHHLSLTDKSLKDYDTNFKMNPPIRREEDRQALIKGLLDGTIDIIGTDHAPHADYEKDNSFSQAPFGVLGLQTLLPISLEILVHSGKCNLPFLLSRLTDKPAKLLGLNKGTLSSGVDADIAIFDPNETWLLTEDKILSKSKNTPWINKKLRGKVRYTFIAGNLIYQF